MRAQAPRGRPRISSIQSLRQAAGQFCPPYEIAREAPQALRITLHDPNGRLPELVVRHHQQRRLLLKANYLVVEAIVAGDGPVEDGELVFRFMGSLKRQRPSFRWRKPVEGGEEWAHRLEEPLMSGVRKVQAIESLRIGWSESSGAWLFRLETMSGSVVGGFMSPVPIPVPMDHEEAEGIIEMVEALGETGG